MKNYESLLWEKDEYGNAWQTNIIGYIGIDGKQVKRTKKDYPYSYDPYIVWSEDYDEQKSITQYSDRLYQYDYKKFNACCKEIWGNESQYFSTRIPEDIEKFLSNYLGKPIKLTMIMEGCNASNGYPYWRFEYEEK